MGGLPEQDGDDVDLGGIDDLTPVGRESLDAEVAGQRLTLVSTPGSEGGDLDRPPERRDVVECAQGMRMGARDPAGTEQPDPDRFGHGVRLGQAVAQPPARGIAPDRR